MLTYKRIATRYVKKKKVEILKIANMYPALVFNSQRVSDLLKVTVN